MKKITKKTIIVLGMHRSGTSMVAGLLTKMGINMGDELVGKTPSNPFGHFEDRDFVRLNDTILKNAGGKWDEPPSRESILSQNDKFKKDIEELIKKKNYLRSAWGWKDPRSSLTINLYMPYLINPYFIVCQRKSSEIANSLRRRNHFEIKKSLDLTEIYNKRIDNFFNDNKFLTKLDIYYDDFLKNPKENIRKIEMFLSIDINEEKIDSLTNYVVPKNKIRKISKKLLVIKYLKMGLMKPWKIIPFVYKKIKKTSNFL